LAQCLVNISEVLKGKGDEFAKARMKEVDDRIEKMSKEERKEKFNNYVLAYQEPLDNEEEKVKSMEGQTYQDVNNSKFVGNADQGKEIFKQIERVFKEQQAIKEKLKAQQDYRQWEQEEEAMEGIESSSRTQQNNSYSR